MRKILFIAVMASIAITLFSACASSSRGKGCPTNNPRYFRG